MLVRGVKLLGWSLVLGLFGNPQPGAARGVSVQNFQVAAGAPGFRMSGATSAPVASERTNGLAVDNAPPDPLVAAFARFDNDPSNEPEMAAWQRPPGKERQLHPRYSRMASLTDGKVTSSDYAPDCVAGSYRPNQALKPAVARRRAVWYDAMARAACEAGVPAALFDAMIVQESGYNPFALSAKGAASLAQLMPGRARALGVGNIWDPVDNLRGGARYLRALLDEFGRFDLALAAYNAGEGRVRGTLQVPHIRETVNYVSAILTSMRDQMARQRTAAYAR